MINKFAGILLLLVFLFFIFFISNFIYNYFNFKLHLLNADMVLITFFIEDNGNHNKEKSIRIYNKKEIKNLVNCISIVPAPFYKCGYSGKFLFYKNNTSILEDDIDFSINLDCRHIVFLHRNKVFSKRLTKKGYIYLSKEHKRLF